MSHELQENEVGHAAGEHKVHATVRILGHGTETFPVSPQATLLELMVEGARLAGFALLPPKEHPFDKLHGMKGDEVEKPIHELDQTVGEYLRHAQGDAHFAIELVAAFRVNTRWAVATGESMTPRDILALPKIHLEHSEYTLYLPGQTVPLPLDTPIRVERGADFEAQRDGKYGGEGRHVS